LWLIQRSIPVHSNINWTTVLHFPPWWSEPWSCNSNLMACFIQPRVGALCNQALILFNNLLQKHQMPHRFWQSTSSPVEVFIKKSYGFLHLQDNCSLQAFDTSRWPCGTSISIRTFYKSFLPLKANVVYTCLKITKCSCFFTSILLVNEAGYSCSNEWRSWKLLAFWGKENKIMHLTSYCAYLWSVRVDIIM